MISIIIILLFWLLNNSLKKVKREEFFSNYIDYPPFPIDFVYTWKGEDITNDIRTSYNNELKYSLRSIDLYAPWANKIYILVDPPKKYPSWINESSNKIVIVDTSETFPSEKYLPNSNSNAIETTIFNIPGLSEHYIYLCDDIFIGKETKYTDFFTEDGKAIVDGKCIINNSALKEDNENTLNINFPPTVNRFYPHIPIPQIKSLVKEFVETYPDYIEWVRTTKKRHDDGTEICKKYDLNQPCQQIHYPICKFMLDKGRAILENYDSSKVMFFMSNRIYKNGECLLKNILIVRPLFYCINDDEKDPEKRIKVREDMLTLFDTYYPNKASFELLDYDNL